VSERLDSRIHELEEKPRPFTALYEHCWERNQWSLFDLDFNVDAESYARLDDEAAQRLRWIFATALTPSGRSPGWVASSSCTS
jgi:hypothetical protein